MVSVVKRCRMLVCRYKMKAKEVKNENASDATEDNNEIISGRNILSIC